MSLSRRELFGMFRRPARTVAPAAQDTAPRPVAVPASPRDRAAPATFSLDVFYAQRGAAPMPPAPDQFTVRGDHAAVPSTRIGAGSIGEASAPSAAFEPPAPSQRTAARLDPGWLPEVLPARCLARSFCMICVERCPTPGAIAFAGGSPRIDPARCDGCGICVMVCPAPTLAFQLVRREAP